MIFYYGGKFNPITRGHISVIDRLIEKYKDRIAEGEEFKLVIGIKGKNLPGSDSAFDSFGNINRYEMVKKAVNELIDTKWRVFASSNKLLHASIDVVFQTEDRTWAYFHSDPEWYPKDETYNPGIVLGEDEYHDLLASTDPNAKNPKWQHAQDILDNYAIEYFLRDSVVSSTRVREIFKANPYVTYNDVADYLTPAVFTYIQSRGMYWQYGEEAYARRKENEFLMSYDMGAFPRPSCTSTCLVVSGSDVLLVRRKGHPYMHYWAMPGGFLDVNKDETLEDTALRELNEEVGIGNLLTGSFKQFHTYSNRGQDPRGRIVDTVFLFELSRLDVEDKLKAGDDAAEYSWWPLDKLPRMAFNHKLVIDDYLRLRKSHENDAKGA